MTRGSDLLLTAIAPAVWGSTYFVTTEFLPAGYPMTAATFRALPAGLLLLLVVRRLPEGLWWRRVILLGALNFSVFWAMLFVAAYRLPGGVAATVAAIQPLIVIFLARVILGSAIRGLSIAAALAGMAGVALLLLTPSTDLDPVGIVAGLAGAASMACGTVLSRRWQPPVSPLTFAAWQLTAGGALLLPVALLLEPPLPALTPANIAAFTYLFLIGAALTSIIWFRGVSLLEPSVVATLGFLSPLTAVLLGWRVLDQGLTATQITGMVIVLGSVWLSQRAQDAGPLVPATIREHHARPQETSMQTVSITYCKPCGYEKRAAAAALKKELGLTADLVPGKGGIFEVRVGDKVVAKRSMGHFPDETEIVKAVAAAVKAAPAA